MSNPKNHNHDCLHNDAMCAYWKDFNCHVHFFEDDCIIDYPLSKHIPAYVYPGKGRGNLVGGEAR